MKYFTFIVFTAIIFAVVVTSYAWNLSQTTQEKSASLSAPAIVSTFRGEDYQDVTYSDGTHVWTGGLEKWIASSSSDSEGRPIFVPYTLQETGNQIIYNSGSASFKFDKTTCQLDLQSQNNAKTIIENANVDVVEDTGTKFDKATTLESKNCSYELKQNAENIQFFVRQGDLSTGIKEIEYKTSVENGLEPFMRFNNTNVAKENKEFGFVEEIIADSVIFKGEEYTPASLSKSVDLQKSDITSTFNGKIYDKIVTLKTGSDKVFYNIKDSVHDATDHVTLEKTPDGTQVKVTTFYTNTNNLLSKNEVLEIDPTYTTSNPTEDGDISTATSIGTTCPVTGATRDTTNIYGTLHIDDSDLSSLGCYRTYFEWDMTSIPTSAVVSSTVFKFGVDSVSSPKNTTYVDIANRPSTATTNQTFNDIRTGTVYVSNDATATTAGNSKSVTLGSTANSKVESQIVSAEWFSLGVRFHNETRDSASAHIIRFATEEHTTVTPKPTLEITYIVPTAPAQVTGLVVATVSTTRLDLSWTAPNDGGSAITGYKIERQTHTSGCSGGTMSTLVANTGTSAVTYSDMSALPNTCYSYQISAINAIGTGSASTSASGTTFDNPTIGAEGYFKTGRWYSSNTYSAIAPTTQETTANVLRAFPFIVGKGFVADRIQFEVTAAVSSTNCNVGIYASNSALYPTTLVVNGSQQSTASVGLKTTTINSTLTSNKLYWLAYSCNGAPILAAIPPAGLPSVLGYSGSGGLGTQGTGWTVANTYASTLPSTYPVNGTILSNTNGILIQVRVK